MVVLRRNSPRRGHQNSRDFSELDRRFCEHLTGMPLTFRTGGPGGILVETGYRPVPGGCRRWVPDALFGCHGFHGMCSAMCPMWWSVFVFGSRGMIPPSRLLQGGPLIIHRPFPTRLTKLRPLHFSMSHLIVPPL
jgi:hypothetical protein